MGICVAVLWAASPASAAPGDLDTTFGNGGRVVLDLGGNESGPDTAVLGDGRVVVAASTSVGANPERASSLAGPPKVKSITLVPPVPKPGSTAPAVLSRVTAALDLAADERIVTAGFTNLYGPGRNFGVAKLDTSGAPDASFGRGAGLSSGSIGVKDVICAGGGNDKASSGPGRT